MNDKPPNEPKTNASDLGNAFHTLSQSFESLNDTMKSLHESVTKLQSSTNTLSAQQRKSASELQETATQLQSEKKKQSIRVSPRATNKESTVGHNPYTNSTNIYW